MKPLDAATAARTDQNTPQALLARTAERMRTGLHTQKLRYAVSLQGGAIGAVVADVPDTIPENAVVTKAWIRVTETFTSSTDAATIAVSLVGADDIVAAIAISNVANAWDAGFQAAIQDGAAANFLAVTADFRITVTVAVEVLLLGAMDIHLEYSLPADA